MTDPCCGRDRECRTDGAGNPDSVTRRPSVTADLDAVFDLLSDRRRRYLLYSLLETDADVVEFDDLAEAVSAYEASGPDDHASRETVEIELHHVHLPRLAEGGLLEYDRRQGTVRFDGWPALEEWAEHARYKEIEE